MWHSQRRMLERLAAHKRLAVLARALGVAGGFSIVTYYAAYYAYRNVFTYFAAYDDEGYLLISLHLFHKGHALYDAVYSQYGPAYYEIMEALLTVLGLDVTHDNGRFITTALWTGTALIGGLTIFGLTRNVWLGLAVQALMTQSLLSLRAEPMHPGGLICFLLACAGATALLLPRRPRLAWTLFGILSAAVVLIKINVGVFASFAIGFVALCASVRWRVLLWIAGAGIVCAPALLMAANFRLPWVRHYIVIVTAALLPLVVMLIRYRPNDRSPLVWLLAGAAGTMILVCAIAMLQGTSLAALVHAVLLAPLGQADAFMVPMILPAGSTLFAVIASAIGLFVAWKKEKPADPHRLDDLFVIAFSRIATGLAFWITVPGLFREWPLGFLLAPLAWVIAAPPRNIVDSPALSFARRFLPLFAVLQTLHAYPVASSQFFWSSFLLVLVGAICIFDGARQFASLIPGPLPITANILGIALCFSIAGVLRGPMTKAAWTRSLNETLGLHGAHRVALPAEMRSEFRNLSRLTRENCTTFLTAPGMASFYFWTGREPPTGMNATAWMYLFNAGTQRKIVQDADLIEDLCVIRCRQMIDAWSGGRPIPESPLLDYISRNFTPVAQFGCYELLERRRAGNR